MHSIKQTHFADTVLVISVLSFLCLQVERNMNFLSTDCEGSGLQYVWGQESEVKLSQS